MNRNLIFVFILFATFSIINAIPHQLRKRETEFNTCPFEGVDPLTVKVSPDPPVSEQPTTYTVSGTLTHDIITGLATLEILYSDDTGQNTLAKPFAQIFADSYKAGTPLTITAIDNRTPKLPDSYTIGVVVGGSTTDLIHPINIYGCEFAVVSKSAEKKAYPIAGYLIEGLSYPIAERSYPIAERSYPIAERS